jgi:rhamnosyltransferase subunit B
MLHSQSSFPERRQLYIPGGVGTTGQAMRSGHPMLVLPFANDQPDNADRVRRLGIARVVSRAEYTVDRAAQELDSLFTARGYQLRAREVGERVSMQDGARDVQ